MDLATAWHYLSRMFTLSAWAKPNLWLLRMYLTGNEKVSNWADFKLPDVRVLLVLIPALLLDWNQYRRKSETFFMDWSAWAKGLFLAMVVLALLLLSFAETGAPFVYQGF
ncbi:MAG: hypothetical protein Q8N46_09580, partial [Anaerolineales bacterium]|nr:hypothetical protein [Anaerolineales bacterium]